MTFLYKAQNAPKYSGSASFTDVPAGKWYTEPINWAVSNGITSGVGNNRFGVSDTCTRVQIVAFLYKAVNSPIVSLRSDFTDVPTDKWFAPAVSWAVSNGITSGTSTTEFSPNAPCTRAQIMTFLYKMKQIYR